MRTKLLAFAVAATVASIAILLLREVEGMSYEDLSRTLEIPKGTVMSRLFHARTKVQKILSEYLELDESKSGLGNE